jgi:HAE1 family hydrophobic/amphiphilic exporter-1/multidrug efflux pump
VLVALGFSKMPSGFLPDEDQGFAFTMVQLPPGATQQRTQEVVDQVEKHFLQDEKDSVDSIFTVTGFSFAGSGQNMAMGFIKLKPWDERRRADQSVSAITRRALVALGAIPDATVFTVAPPAVAELGNATGFDLMLQDRAGLGHDALMAARNQLLGALGREPGLVAVRPNGMDDTPEYRLDIDEHRLASLGLAAGDVNDTLAIAWGGRYVNDFMDNGRVKKVMLQGDAPSRMMPSDLERWQVRNSAGTMVPFSAFASAEWARSSPRLERYNGVPSVEILGMAMPGAMSSGDAMALVERHAAELPAGIGYEWTGLSLQEREAGGRAGVLYAVSILFVFLCLAALYESWSVPVAVLLVVPLGVFGALLAALLSWKMNDVYLQVGLLATIGLAAKNAILIVEFARDLHARGSSPVEAALEAARLRLRPIVMTSLAFVLGVLPLMVAKGAGAGAQNALGTAVVGGMLSGTLLAVLAVPLFFVVVQRLFRRRAAPPAAVVEAH